MIFIWQQLTVGYTNHRQMQNKLRHLQMEYNSEKIRHKSSPYAPCSSGELRPPRGGGGKWIELNITLNT